MYEIILNNLPNLNLQRLVTLEKLTDATELVDSLNFFLAENGHGNQYLAELHAETMGDMHDAAR